LTGICIVANEQGNPERIARRDLCFRPIQFPELLKVLSTPKLRIEGPWSAEDTIVKRSPVSAPVGNGSRTKLFALKGQHNSTTQSPVANLGQGEQISAARGRTHQNRGTLFFQGCTDTSLHNLDMLRCRWKSGLFCPDWIGPPACRTYDHSYPALTRFSL